jgi:hypothetical protein
VLDGGNTGEENHSPYLNVIQCGRRNPWVFTKLAKLIFIWATKNKGQTNYDVYWSDCRKRQEQGTGCNWQKLVTSVHSSVCSLGIANCRVIHLHVCLCEHISVFGVIFQRALYFLCRNEGFTVIWQPLSEGVSPGKGIALHLLFLNSSFTLSEILHVTQAFMHFQLWMR